MLRILLASLLVLEAVFGTHLEARAANANCATIPITNLPPAPLTNANLQCDANGNLLTSDQAGTYSAAYGQPAVPYSFKGIAGWSVLGGGTGTDALVAGPASGPAGGLGLPLGTPGILYVQGIAPNGAMPIYSTTGFPISDITLARNADVNNSALLVGGRNGSTTQPLNLDASNYLNVHIQASATGQATMANSQPVTIASDQSVISTTRGGSTNATLAVGASTTIKTGAGRLAGMLITTVATSTGIITCYDNTSASGTIIAKTQLLAGAPAGTEIVEDRPFATGLTCASTTTIGPAATISYY